MIGEPIYLDSRGRTRFTSYEYRSHKDRRGLWWSKRRLLRYPIGVALTDTDDKGMTTVRLHMGWASESAALTARFPVYP